MSLPPVDIRAALREGRSVMAIGDNLVLLREHVPDRCVDLVYLDPPFNSHRDYNVLTAGETEDRGSSPSIAFRDCWVWDDETERQYLSITSPRAPMGRATHELAAFISALRGALGGGNDLLAYIVMMAPRLVELHRVLKETGSLYLHCDPTASHYLKILLDIVFGATSYRREIVWRSGWVSGFKARAKNWVRNHDVILYYVKDPRAAFTFHKTLAYRPHADGYRRRGGGENRLGVALDDVWDETALYSPWIKSFSKEKLGFMTQKPRALLDRILAVSSSEGDLVLDPFCGCGTTVEAARVLGRRWLGMDITHLSAALVRRRLRDVDAAAGRSPAEVDVFGEPRAMPDVDRLLSQSDGVEQFRWWVLGRIGVDPAGVGNAKAGDGIDGIGRFCDVPGGEPKEVVFSVKVKAGEADVRALIESVQRRGAAIGILVTVHRPTAPMMRAALTAGHYEGPLEADRVARVQILGVDEILQGTRPRIPSSRESPSARRPEQPVSRT